MRIYVASSWRNTYQPYVVRDLRADGHEVYDFKGPGDGWGGESGGPGGFSWSEIDPQWKDWVSSSYVTALRHPRAIEGYGRDMNALRRSDACVMVMPCGPSASMEMGWAVGAGKPTAIYVPEIREPDLMVLMAHMITTDSKDLRAWAAGARLAGNRQEKRAISIL